MEKGINNDYPLIPMAEITDEAREVAVRWGDEYFNGIAIHEKHKLASDIMNYARRYHDKKVAEEKEKNKVLYATQISHTEKKYNFVIQNNDYKILLGFQTYPEHKWIFKDEEIDAVKLATLLNKIDK